MIQRWKPPHKLFYYHKSLFHLFLDIVSLELSITRTHAARGSTTDTLSEALRKVKLVSTNYGTIFTDCSLVDVQADVHICRHFL